MEMFKCWWSTYSCNAVCIHLNLPRSNSEFLTKSCIISFSYGNILTHDLSGRRKILNSIFPCNYNLSFFFPSNSFFSHDACTWFINFMSFASCPSPLSLKNIIYSLLIRWVFTETKLPRFVLSLLIDSSALSGAGEVIFGRKMSKNALVLFIIYQFKQEK